jgi:hypothetical protein
MDWWCVGFIVVMLDKELFRLYKILVADYSSPISSAYILAGVVRLFEKPNVLGNNESFAWGH